MFSWLYGFLMVKYHLQLQDKIIYNTDGKANAIDQELNKNVKPITDWYGGFGVLGMDFTDKTSTVK
ncbi:MAG: hypothetical protein Q7U54_10995 [Bacteroidales bacterium]|nr:hypothetical protein [Bacteroidales bacterium]